MGRWRCTISPGKEGSRAGTGDSMLKGAAIPGGLSAGTLLSRSPSYPVPWWWDRPGSLVGLPIASEQKPTPRRPIYWTSWTGRPPRRQGARGRTGRAFLTPNRASLVSEGALTVLSAIQALPAVGGENEAVPRGIVGIERLRRLWGTGGPAALFRVDNAVMGKGDRSSIWKRLRTNCSISSCAFFRPRTSLLFPSTRSHSSTFIALGFGGFAIAPPISTSGRPERLGPSTGLRNSRLQ